MMYKLVQRETHSFFNFYSINVTNLRLRVLRALLSSAPARPAPAMVLFRTPLGPKAVPVCPFLQFSQAGHGHFRAVDSTSLSFM